MLCVQICLLCYERSALEQCLLTEKLRRFHGRQGVPERVPKSLAIEAFGKTRPNQLLTTHLGHVFSHINYHKQENVDFWPSFLQS